MIIEKIKRRLSRFYFDRKLRPVARRPFEIDSYIEELRKEPFQECFHKPVLLLHYDDISLMDGEGFYDYGCKSEGIWQKFSTFMCAFPHLKHTLFFVPNPQFVGTGLTSRRLKNDLFNISHSNADHSLLQKLHRPNVEIAQHGYTHIQSVYKDYYAPFEFDFLTVPESIENLKSGFDGLQKFFSVKGFKPPAWSIGQILGRYQLLEALRSMDFEYVCLSSPSNGLNYSRQKVSHIYPQIYQSLWNIPQNVSILWAWEKTKKILDMLVEKKGIINIQLHFTETRKELRDGICDKNLAILAKIVDYLSQYEIDPRLTHEIKKNSHLPPLSKSKRRS